VSERWGEGMRTRTWRLLVTLCALGLVLTGCGSGTRAETSQSPSAATVASSAASPTAGSTAPTGPGVTIAYEGNAQVELRASGGARVLVDVWDPEALSAPPTSEDVLLTTHTHDDHVSPDFQADFPGEQLFVKAGKMDTSTATIRSIPAAHSEGDPIVPEGGTDYIFVIDMGGLRIVHFGDLGQDSLTPEQLAAIGDVDVAVMQFENSFSQMDAENGKGFDLMQQVNPRLIIQTHTSLAAVQEAAKLWPLLYSPRSVVRVTATELPAETSMLLLGEDGTFYADNVPATEVGW